MTNEPGSSIDIANLPVGALLVDTSDGRVLVANARARELLGDEDLTGAQLSALFDDPAFVDVGDVRGEPLRLRIAARSTNGLGRFVDLRAALTDHGLLVTVEDVSEEERLAAVVDVLADSSFLLADDGIILWQRIAPNQTGEGVDLIGINPFERIHPEDLPMMMDAFVEAVAQPGTRVQRVARSRVGDGNEWQQIDLEGIYVEDVAGLPGVVVRVRNLSDGSQVARLGQTEGSFLSLTDAAPIGIVVGDMLGRTVYANTAAQDVLLESATAHDWWRQARPEHQEELHAAIDRALFGGVEDTITAAFGDEGAAPRWLRVHLTPRYNEGRQAVGLITTLEDVTTEVEAREETRRLTQMLDATSDFVAVFRPNGDVLYVNDALQRILDDLVAAGGRGRLSDLIDDELREAWLAAALAALADTNVWQGEIDLKAGDDRTIPVSALGVVKRNDDGELEWVAMLARDISDLKVAQRELEHLATHDYLTGLPNRSLFNERLDDAVARHKRSGEAVAVLFCDLDGFKRVNDEFGHAAGDQLLVEVASRLRSITRASETAARVGGDEFVLVITDVADNDELAALAERVIHAVSAPVDLDDGNEVKVGISVGVGVAWRNQGNVESDRLLTVADTAMYQAKARGGKTFRIVTVD